MNHPSLPTTPPFKRTVTPDESPFTLLHSPTEAHKKPEAIVPPDNFASIESGLYRSALPNARNFPFVRSLRLRTVIILSSERPVRNILTFFENHAVRVAHTGLQGWSPETSWKPVADEVVKESLEIILHCDSYPILVCDVTGVHLVGMVVSCLRRLQNWNLNAVLNEYRLFAAMTKTHYVNEQFIELFDTDLVTVPENPPTWFAELMDMEERDRCELQALADQNLVDASGTLVDMRRSPQYIVYYYSSAGPLNSQVGGTKPRIQTM